MNGDTGPNVVLDASDVGADPAGTASSAIAAHVADADPHTQYLKKSGDTTTGVINLGASLNADGNNIAMGGGNISNAATIAATVAVNAPLHSGVPLTTGGPSGAYLDADGAYTEPPDTSVMTLEFSDAGARQPGASLRSGGDRFGNKTPGQSQGASITADVSLNTLAWNCTVNNVGVGAAIEVALIRANSVILTQDVVINAPLQGALAISPAIDALAGDSIYVGWSPTNAGAGTRTVLNLDVTITGTLT